MIVVLFGDLSNAIYLIKDGLVKEKLFSNDFGEITNKIATYRKQPFKVICFSRDSVYVRKRLSRVYTNVAVEAELEQYKDFDIKEYFVADRISNVHIFACAFFNEVQLQVVSALEKVLKWTALAQIECLSLIEECRRGIEKRDGAIDILVLDTQVSGFIVFVYEGLNLLHCEEIDIMGEKDVNIVAGFVSQYLEGGLFKKWEDPNVFLIARQSIVTSLVQSFNNNVSHMVALNPSEAAIIMGVESESILAESTVDAVIALMSCKKGFKFKYKLHLTELDSLYGFCRRNIYKVLTPVVLAYFIAQLTQAYFSYKDYWQLIDKSKTLGSKYYELKSTSSFAKNDELLWIYHAIKATQVSPVGFINNLNVDDSSLTKLDWRLLYSPEIFIERNSKVKVQICVGDEKYEGKDSYECVIEEFA